MFNHEALKWVSVKTIETTKIRHSRNLAAKFLALTLSKGARAGQSRSRKSAAERKERGNGGRAEDTRDDSAAIYSGGDMVVIKTECNSFSWVQ